MCCRNRLLSVLLLAALLLSACQPITPPERPQSPEPQGLRPDAPEYAKHGPYWVGYAPVVIGEGTARPIEAALWYPAQNPDGMQEEATYTYRWKSLGEPGEPLAVNGHALLDAAPDASGAPYPLVVLSHAFGAGGAWYSTIIEHLASHGFIVLAPEHMDRFDPELSELWSATIDRPRDIQKTLDYAEQLTAPGGDLAGLIDMENVAVAGHSTGGYTALAMAGAQFDLDGYNARCAELPPDDPNMFLCMPFVSKEADMATRAELESVPEGLWPSFGDSRVKAIIPIAGDSYMFDKAGLAKITIPMMAIGGTADTSTPFEWGSKPSYEYVSSTEKALVTFDGAEHTIMTSCESMPWMQETPYYIWVCFDPVWDKDRGQDLINHFTTAFLLAELKGDTEAAAALAPENVAFPGIQFQSTGYSPAASAALDDATVAKIESMVEAMMAENEIPGYALGIVKDGQIAYTKGFGVERIGEDKPVTEHTVFGTGCVGKTTVATALMQLVEAGKIDLDAPVTDYLPDFKLADERYRDITVRHLITHRSGLPEIEDFYPLPVEEDDGVLERYVRSLDNMELLFAPGEEWAYSGTGFVVVADIIQKVSGQTFEDYLQQHVLDPLGMEDSLLIVRAADQTRVAGNHVHNDAGEVVVSDIFPYRRQFAATGPLYSSITDLVRYAAAHLNRGELDGQRILPTATYDAMWEPLSETNFGMFPGITSHYGLGWGVGELDGHREVDHFGADEGYAALMILAPDDNLAVVMATNFFDLDEWNPAPWGTGIEVMQTLLAEGQ